MDIAEPQQFGRSRVRCLRRRDAFGSGSYARREGTEIRVMIARHNRAFFRLTSFLIFVGLIFSVSVPVRAEVSIEGGTDALRVETNRASLEDVLAALRARFNLRYHTSSALDGSITGIYQGPLERVTSRLLDGYDFIMKRSAENIEIFVLQRHAQDDRTIATSSNPEAVAATPGPPPGIQQTTNARAARPRVRAR